MHLKKSFLEDCEVEIQVLNIYFSDPNVLEVKISKKNIAFMTFWLKMIKTAIPLENFYNFSHLHFYLKCGFSNTNRICN